MYFVQNNKIYYNRSGQSVFNELPEASKDLANYTYPNDIKFGINYDIIDNQKLREENFSANTIYFLYNKAFNSINTSTPILGSGPTSNQNTDE